MNKMIPIGSIVEVKGVEALVVSSVFVNETESVLRIVPYPYGYLEEFVVVPTDECTLLKEGALSTERQESGENEEISLGGVVQIENVLQPILIIGYMPMNKMTGRTYDYLGTGIARGVVGEDSLILFDKESIIDVKYPGYQTEKL